MRRLRLLVRVGEDHRAVLGAYVGALAVHLRGVVRLPELLEQLVIGDPVGVELHLADLCVPGRVAADLLIGGIVDGAALVADGGVENSREVAIRRLDLPEAARPEGRLLAPRLARRLVGGHRAPSMSRSGSILPRVVSPPRAGDVTEGRGRRDPAAP